MNHFIFFSLINFAGSTHVTHEYHLVETYLTNKFYLIKYVDFNFVLYSNFNILHKIFTFNLKNIYYFENHFTLDTKKVMK
jgi:hypothetical protein